MEAFTAHPSLSLLTAIQVLSGSSGFVIINLHEAEKTTDKSARPITAPLCGKTSETANKISRSDKQAGCLLFLTQYQVIWYEFFIYRFLFLLRICCFRTFRLFVRCGTSVLDPPVSLL